MQKGILEQLGQLEIAVNKTREIAGRLSERVSSDLKRLDSAVERLGLLQDTLNQANKTVGEIRADLEA